MTTFSRRVPRDFAPNAYTRARSRPDAVRFDLTVTNPTACGIDYPDDLLDALSSTAGLAYRPDPKGLGSAREAIAAEYARRGVTVDPGAIVLTASSSEAYAFLFKLLCDPGDAVLVPVPSYPLFEHLAELEGVRTTAYPLDETHRWQPQQETPVARGARAAIFVHPNNPTGSFVDADAAERVARGLPFIVDEVFADYPWSGDPPSFAPREHGLTFTLGGLSKSRGLPQLKLSWIIVGGPPADRAAALEALEFIGDNYLSVATPVQAALPEILRRSLPVQDAIRSRCRGNLDVARTLVRAGGTVERLDPEGGWSLVLRFPRVVGEESLALELLERHGVAVHPGYFFDFPGEGYLVLSLLPAPAVFEAGLRTVLDAIDAKV